MLAAASRGRIMKPETNHHMRAADVDTAAGRQIPLAASLATCLCSLMLFGEPGCRNSTTPVPSTASVRPRAVLQFQDITAESGVDSTFRNGREAGVFSILESLGGGTGVLDFDQDGWVDLFFTGGGGFEGQKIFGHSSRLFRNLTGKQFVNVSTTARLVDPYTYTQGCSTGDYDCDGFPDILVTGYAGLQLFHNLGDGAFEEVHVAAGLTDALWSSSAAWGDLSGDGWPDLYVTHYVDWSFENNPFCPSPWPEHDQDVCPPRAFAPLPDVVYYSRGDGTFRDATSEAGLRSDGKGLGVILADLDHDADLDVYVANDMVDNFLYENDGAGHFVEMGLLTGTATDFEGKANGSMGLAVCDYDDDLKPDLWVTNFEQETFALYRNEGAGIFVHASREAGITALGNLFVGFGTAMADLDCDGDEDALIANGHVVYYPTVSSQRQEALLLENIGGGLFVRVDPGGYFSEQHVGRGLVTADLNNDGLPDAVAGNSNEPAAVLLNTTQATGSWVRLRLVGRKSGRDAVGARVVLKSTTGDQLRHVAGGGSFESQNDIRVHFGVPAGAEPLTATIWWPDGTVQSLDDITPRETIIVVEE
jgi:enediyne biosynthesis protein E4